MERLLIVTGPPGAGKTTVAVPLARMLGIPLITKDTIKEALLDTFGVTDPEASAQLGQAAYDVMFALARHMDAVVLESNFGSAAIPMITDLCPTPVQIHCRCDPAVSTQRYRDRAPERHPGHFDALKVDSIRARTAAGDFAPLAIPGPLLMVDTNAQVDIEELAEWVRSQAP